MTDQPRALHDEPAVIGGKRMPESLVAMEVEDEIAPTDDLGYLAYWLVRLYPDKVPAEFANYDPRMADDGLKSRLIEAMHKRLGISPLKSTVILAE